jgi:hypothetical protein
MRSTLASNISPRAPRWASIRKSCREVMHILHRRGVKGSVYPGYPISLPFSAQLS